MKTTKQILITGSAGRLGRAAVRALLAAGHQVRGYDRLPTPGLLAEHSTIAELEDTAQLRQAMAAVQVLIHLAAAPDDAQFPRGTPPNDGDNFLSELVPSNIVGLYDVLEAARQAMVDRVILASSGQVIDGHLRNGNIPATGYILPQPRYLYACTKVFLEAMGQVYATKHDLNVLAVRLGWCPRDDGQVEQIRASGLAQDVYLSPNDAGRFFVCSVECEPWNGYRMLYATSRHRHQLHYDLEPTRKLIGYEPAETWPTGADDFAV